MLVVGTGANGQEALRLCEHTAVDVLVMDVRMPVMDGIEATRLLVERAGTPNILILTTFNTDQLVLDAVAAGARGFLLKDAEPDIVLSGIRAIHRGEAVVSPRPPQPSSMRCGTNVRTRGEPPSTRSRTARSKSCAWSAKG